MKDSEICIRTRAAVTDYLEEALDPGRRVIMDWHMARCATCRNDLQIMRRLLRHLAAASSEPAPVELKERVLTMVREHAASH